MCLVKSVFLNICDNNHRSGGKKAWELGKVEKKDVLVVGHGDLCVSLWWDIKVAQVVFGLKFSFRAWNLTYE